MKTYICMRCGRPLDKYGHVLSREEWKSLPDLQSIEAELIEGSCCFNYTTENIDRLTAIEAKELSLKNSRKLQEAYNEIRRACEKSECECLVYGLSPAEIGMLKSDGFNVHKPDYICCDPSAKTISW